MQLLLENKAEVDKAAADGSKTDVRTPLCRAAGNNHTNQLGGTRELSSTLRYKLLPHMSMAAVKPSLSSPPPPPPPPPWNGKPPKRTVQSFDLRVFDRERFGAYAIWLGHHFKGYKQEGEWI
jgi:hypothetical protein